MKTAILVHWIGFLTCSNRREEALTFARSELEGLNAEMQRTRRGAENSGWGILSPAGAGRGISSALRLSAAFASRRLFRPGLFRFSLILASVALVLMQGTAAHATGKFTLETAQQAAEKGNVKALYFLAKAYSKGNGVPQDYEKAADYMRQAANKGYAFAQNDLGTLYAKGLGVKQDNETAAIWYLQAAENGDSLAQYNMGQIYAQGRGVPKDIRQSLGWYQKAAKQNHPEAMIALGTIYMEGAEGVARDCKQAITWFEKAARIGRVETLNNMGFIYERGGPGVKKDLTLAVFYYRQAADKGFGKAQMNLGCLYNDGRGVTQDRVEAYKWFLLSTQNGAGAANHYLQKLEGLPKPLLTPAQIAEARRRAEAWNEAREQQATGKY